MSASEAFLVDTQERNRVANQIYFFLRDGMDEMPEELGLKAGNYPESEAKLMELLSTHEGREQLKNILEDAAERLASGEAELKWRHVKSPEYLLSEIADLDRERLEFPLPDAVEVAQEDFITQDEIDYALGRGSGYEHGAFRIYEYFMEGHDQKETVAFLKMNMALVVVPADCRVMMIPIMNMMEKVSVWRKAVMAIRMQKCF